MHLTKHHGLGNDFVVLRDPTGSQAAGADLARAVCDRHRGIGADGLLLLGPGGAGADISMVLLNADGSRAEMSGNGIGCLVQAALLAGDATGPVVVVRTDAGLRAVGVRPGEAPRVNVAMVSMGPPAVGDDQPEWLDGDLLRATPVSMGNPHLVLQAADPDALDDRAWVADVGARINGAVPGGVNVEVVAPDDGGGLRMDVYERGVGLTFACGTGACAAAAAARRWELVGDRVPVRMAGGTAAVDLTGPEATLTTPITYVAAVDFAWP